MRIGIDVDGVLNSMHTVWVKWYNMVFLDDVDPEGWVGWGFEDFPGDKCSRDEFYKFLCPELYTYDRLLPYEGSAFTLDWIRDQGHDITFVTSCGDRNFMAGAKLGWLVRHFLFREGDLYMPVGNKAEAPVDVLFDDGPHNVEDFRGSLAVLVDQPHNAYMDYPHRVPSIHHAPRYLELLRQNHLL